MGRGLCLALVDNGLQVYRSGDCGFRVVVGVV